ncbi:MAG: hypothetical protein R3B70_34550 [Polyangiaceae bacterium]
MRDEASDRRLLPALFDRAQGWPFSEDEVPLSEGEAPDGNPFVVVEIDGREVVVAEKTAWAGDEEEAATPHRIVAFLAFTGVAVEDLSVLLKENLGTHGLPAWGLDDDGDLTLSVSVLVGPNVPLDIARRQLLVGIGLIAETVDKVLAAVSERRRRR